MKFTARFDGRNMISESGSGADTAKRRRRARPSEFAFEAGIPKIPEACSFLYLSRAGGSSPLSVMASTMDNEARGAVKKGKR